LTEPWHALPGAAHVSGYWHRWPPIICVHTESPQQSKGGNPLTDKRHGVFGAAHESIITSGKGGTHCLPPVICVHTAPPQQVKGGIPLTESWHGVPGAAHVAVGVGAGEVEGVAASSHKPEEGHAVSAPLMLQN